MICGGYVGQPVYIGLPAVGDGSDEPLEAVDLAIRLAPGVVVRLAGLARMIDPYKLFGSQSSVHKLGLDHATAIVTLLALDLVILVAAVGHQQLVACRHLDVLPGRRQPRGDTRFMNDNLRGEGVK